MYSFTGSSQEIFVRETLEDRLDNLHGEGEAPVALVEDHRRLSTRRRSFVAAVRVTASPIEAAALFLFNDVSKETAF